MYLYKYLAAQLRPARDAARYLYRLHVCVYAACVLYSVECCIHDVYYTCHTKHTICVAIWIQNLNYSACCNLQAVI